MDDRIEVSGTSGVLLAGDVLAILAFVVAGEFRHYPTDVALSRTPETFVPFLLGWLVVAPVAGAYAAGIGRRPLTGGLTVGVTWVGAALLGHAIRATAFFSGGFDLTFVAVSLVVGGVLLVAWRVALGYALLAR